MKVENSILKSRLTQSYIRGVDAKSEEEQVLREEQKKIYRVVNQNFLSTIKNEFSLDRESMEDKYASLKRVITDVCRDLYDKNINNFQ